MLFTDALFLPFLIGTFLLWLPWGGTGRKRVLLAASLVFYASWDVRFLLPLAWVWLIVRFVPPALAPDAAPGRAAGGRRGLLAGGIAALLLPLLACKYLDFFAEIVRALLGHGGAGGALRLILPVGISFYTFQAIGYLVDAHRGRVQPSRSALDTGLFAGFFPLLFAGPIERAPRWLPQLAVKQSINAAGLRDALERMLVGYLFKAGVADPLAPYVADIFGRTGSAGSGELLAGVFLYAIQLFADFAGYSQIARGVARLFGYEVVLNFAQPYFARSFSEFWRRWHISLSSWIWDYLFNPMVSACLRGADRLRLATVEAEMRLAYPVAALATMLLCGLWHGAGWTFVVWGGLHGLFLTIERLFVFGSRAIALRPRIRSPLDRVRAFAAGALVFTLVSLTFVVFRAANLGEAVAYLTRLPTAGGWAVSPKLGLLLLLSAAVTFGLTAVEYRRRDEWVFRAAPGWGRGFAYAAAVAYWVLIGGSGGKVPFIYFQF